MLLAAQSMAVGTVMVRWVSKYVDPVVATGWVSGEDEIPCRVPGWKLILRVYTLGTSGTPCGVVRLHSSLKGVVVLLPNLCFLLE